MLRCFCERQNRPEWNSGQLSYTIPEHALDGFVVASNIRACDTQGSQLMYENFDADLPSGKLFSITTSHHLYQCNARGSSAASRDRGVIEVGDAGTKLKQRRSMNFKLSSLIMKD